MKLTAEQQRVILAEAVRLGPVVEEAGRDVEVRMLVLETRVVGGLAVRHLSADERTWGACQGSTRGLQCDRAS